MCCHLSRAESPSFVLQNTSPMGCSAYNKKVPRSIKGRKCYILECLFHFEESITYALQNLRNP